MQVDTQFEKFQQSIPPEHDKIMTKQLGRSIVKFRMPSEYKRRECLVVETIIDGTKEEGVDWQHVNLHSEQAICLTTVSAMALALHWAERTIQRALRVLENEGILIVIPQAGTKYNQNGYKLNLRSIQDLPRKVKANWNRTAYDHQRYKRLKAETKREVSR